MTPHETIAALSLRANGLLIDAAAQPRTATALIDCAAHLRVLKTLLSVNQNALALGRAREIYNSYALGESLLMLAHGAQSVAGSTEDWLDHIHRRA